MMTTYHLPEGMTAEKLRAIAGMSASQMAHDLRAWADAIDPPEPPSVVTDEMVGAVLRAAFGSAFGDWTETRALLEAAERLGLLLDAKREERPMTTDDMVSVPRELAERVLAQTPLAAATYSEAETSECVDRSSPEYQRETAMAAAERLAGDEDHRAKVAELRRRIDAGEVQCSPMDIKAMMKEALGDYDELDAILNPPPAVTDEMVDAVANEIIRPSFDDGYLSLRMIEGVLTAAIECGWTPPGEAPESQSYLLSEISRLRLALKVHGIEGDDLGSEVHNLVLDNRYVRDRLAMAESLLRRAHGHFEYTDPPQLSWVTNGKALSVDGDEAEYLLSLDGEGDE